MSNTPVPNTTEHIAHPSAASDSTVELSSYIHEPAFRRLHTLVQLTCIQPLNTSALSTPHSALLISPPGTGKTTFIRILARHLQIPLVHVRPTALSPSSLASAFDAARRQQPALLCMDDVDLLLPRVSDDETWQYMLLSSFLDQLAKLSASADRVLLVMLCSTTGATRLSPAVRSAVELTLEASLPTAAERLLVLHHLLSPLCEDHTAAEAFPYLPAVVAECGGKSGADLLALVSEAADQALLREREVPTHADFQAALRLVSASSAGATVKVEIDKQVAWDDIVGMEHIKQQVRDCLIPLLHHFTTATPTKHPLLSLLRSPPGVLLYGPPGTGKTLLAQAVSSVHGISFLSLSLASLLHSHIGESERALLSAFQRAQSVAPAVLFIDELDALFSATTASTSTTHTSSRLISTLCTLLDTIHSNRLPLLLLAASNVPQHLHPRLLLPSRFGLLLHVGLPTAVERVCMARRVMAEVGVVSDGSGGGAGMEGVERAVEEVTAGFTMADVRFLMSLCLRGREGGRVSESAVREARGRMSGSVSDEMARSLQRWEDSRRQQVRQRAQRVRESE